MEEQSLKKRWGRIILVLSIVVGTAIIISEIILRIYLRLSSCCHVECFPKFN